MKTAYWLSLFKKISFSLLLAASLTACEFSSKEELIEAYGRTMGKDGYMTKDDYVIKWPAVHRGDVVAPPLTLKIPKKYLRVLQLSTKSYNKAKDGSITRIYVMSSVPGPEPWVEPFPWDKEIKLEYFNFFEHYRDIKSGKKSTHTKEFLEKRALYAEAMRNSVSIGIFRGTLPNSDLFRMNSYDITYGVSCSGLAIGEYHIEDYIGSGCLREPDIDGLESYVRLICYSEEQLYGTYQDKSYKDNLQRKAADDNSPENCFRYLEDQMLRTPPNTPKNEQVVIECHVVGCDAKFPFHKRRVEVLIEGIYSKNTYGKKNDPKKSMPMRNEVNTELLRWREKVDVARKLVNSFVVEQAKT